MKTKSTYVLLVLVTLASACGNKSQTPAEKFNCSMAKFARSIQAANYELKPSYKNYQRLQAAKEEVKQSC